MEGYVYCFSNESMEKYLKIGFTEKTPEERLKEANSSGTWKPPLPYKIELAKRVKNPREKEKTLHKLLSQYCDRPNSSREFFEVTVEEVKTFFKLILLTQKIILTRILVFLYLSNSCHLSIL